MKERLSPFEIAKLAKEKGFVAKTVTTVFTNKYLLGGKNAMITDLCIDLWLNELQKWLREVHKIEVSSDLWDYLGKQRKPTWQFNIMKLDPDSDFIKSHKPKAGTTYEEALEAGLKEALKRIP